MHMHMHMHMKHAHAHAHAHARASQAELERLRDQAVAFNQMLEEEREARSAAEAHAAALEGGRQVRRRRPPVVETCAPCSYLPDLLPAPTCPPTYLPLPAPCGRDLCTVLAVCIPPPAFLIAFLVA